MHDRGPSDHSRRSTPYNARAGPVGIFTGQTGISCQGRVNDCIAVLSKLAQEHTCNCGQCVCLSGSWSVNA